MKEIISILLLGSILILPASLVIGFSYLGKSHPLEEKKITTHSFLLDSTNDIEIVFFGYVGCASICPTSLAKLGTVLDSVEKSYPNTEVGSVFIDINESARQIKTEQYGQQFSRKIRGINISNDEKENIIQQYGLRINKSPNKPEKIFHTDHFFVLKNEEGVWKIKRVLSNDTDKALMKHVIENVVNNRIDN